MLPNTVGPAIHTPPIGKAQCMKKIHASFLLALRICPTLAIGTANIPLFAYKHQMPRSDNNISCGSYIALPYGAMLLAPLQLFFQDLPIIWAVLTEMEKRLKKRWRPPKMKKYLVG
jgi:hypothetical protein